MAEGFVSIHFVNVISRPIVAPFGGRDARFGTNPFTVGIPVAGREPILLDFATSVIAQGKARVAHNKGEKLPLGRIIDDQGKDSDNPAYAVVEPLGAILAFGEHKGYGMAVACELLGGALAAGLACGGPATGERHTGRRDQLERDPRCRGEAERRSGEDQPAGGSKGLIPICIPD